MDQTFTVKRSVIDNTTISVATLLPHWLSITQFTDIRNVFYDCVNGIEKDIIAWQGGSFTITFNFEQLFQEKLELNTQFITPVWMTSDQITKCINSLESMIKNVEVMILERLPHRDIQNDDVLKNQ